MSDEKIGPHGTHLDGSPRYAPCGNPMCCGKAIETPKTDFAEAEFHQEKFYVEAGVKVVPSSLARHLERDLAAANERARKAEWESISERCQRTHMQCCHICEAECGDNTSPLARENARLLTAERKLRELIEAFRGYIKVLGDEVDELAPLAVAHGWKSSRYEAGVEARDGIDHALAAIEEDGNADA